MHTGPIFRLNFGGQPVLVVGSAKIAADLMDRRSSIYSDRPRFIMATEILTGGMNLAFARYGDRWKRMRRVANSCLSSKAASEYTPLQEKEAISLLNNLLRVHSSMGTDLDPILRQSAAATILKTVYSYPDIIDGDPIVHSVENYVDRMLKAALPGSYWVDIFPALNYLPPWIAPWKRQGNAWYKHDTDLFIRLVNDVRIGLDDGTRTNCLTAKLLDPTQKHGVDHIERAWLAGAEAVAATLSFFMLAMVLYPKVQVKLREELQKTVGVDRLPGFAEVKDLPYLGAVIKETLRWRPMGPLAVPHRSIEDDVYQGHLIPAGTIILPNVWAMHHDEKTYPDPEIFMPERFLNTDEKTPVDFADTKDLGHHSFGFGRRSCIGYTVANNALMLYASSIVLTFDIKKFQTQDGEEITPDPNLLLDEGLAVRPVPFPCKLEVLSEGIAQFVKDHNN
ncbi:cytochrome P450 [Collybia nuda]|uniref:Cytochrome P450 n=1 Tax=Collybia nuda TaxID=64659 RepID=A0A9P6CJ30_9AGAR|nr:cytochrome P450 [Collybia nuda]